jgi:DNA-binding CsgD family transcriptional regulator
MDKNNHLSAREQEVVKLVLQAKSYKQIALSKKNYRVIRPL